MPIIKAVLEAKPGKEQELENACRAMVAQVQSETGVFIYTLHRCTDNPRKFFFYEKYADSQAVDFHCNTSYLQAFLKQLPALINGEADIEFYEEIAAVKR